MADMFITECMVEFYAKQAAAVNKAKKDQANLATLNAEAQANFRPTPTTAELNSIASGNPPAALSGSLVSAGKIMRPAAAALSIDKKFTR